MTARSPCYTNSNSNSLRNQTYAFADAALTALVGLTDANLVSAVPQCHRRGGISQSHRLKPSILFLRKGIEFFSSP